MKTLYTIKETAEAMSMTPRQVSSMLRRIRAKEIGGIVYDSRSRKTGLRIHLANLLNHLDVSNHRRQSRRVTA